MSNQVRQSTGISALDERLGGGLMPSGLTVVIGATGVGKTQLGLQFASAGLAQEGRRGLIFDMATRGDAQNHKAYAERMFDWRLREMDAAKAPDLTRVFHEAPQGDYLRVFDYAGRRVNRADLSFEGWQDWQAEMARKLAVTIAFFYGNFIQGARRVVVDGIEPIDRPGDSIQFEMFEYVYHQVIRKEAEWVARDLFRETFRARQAEVMERRYATNDVGCMLLCTSRESMLDDMISRPLDEGDALSNANTLIYMGRVRDGNRLGRGLYVAKHRGSACTDEIVPYAIDSNGLRVL